MTPTKDQQAQEYAEKRLRTTYPNMTLSSLDKAVDLFDTYDIQQAYSDGYTAAEQSQWRSVEEKLPEEYVDVIAFLKPDRWVKAFFDGEDWLASETFEGIEPIYWMPIPPIHNTNTK